LQLEDLNMKIGYARTSTLDQVASFEAQQRVLQGAGCDKIFAEQVSSVAHRDQLTQALDFAREGDCLVVTKLDRLARSMADLVVIMQRLEAKGVSLVVLDLNLDTSTPTGKLMLNLLGSIAQFERELMLERQREGIAKAKAEGKYTGRQATARRKTDEVLSLRNQGLTIPAIMNETGVSRASVFRILKDNDCELV
jgi:DNA invertase Pin-like site-specific DNA recombinase